MKKIKQHLLHLMVLFFIVVITISCKETTPSFPKNEQQARQPRPG